ncbi:MAG: hypothetical protein HUJ91_07925 [Bacteroidales bacterium]|nr:hypothetical protein [Bacteroidales bacterium]
MKRYINIALTAILSLTFAGCQQEYGYDNKGNDNSAEPVQGSIVASLATPETKSAIDDHGKGHFAGVVWTDGDALGVYESSASTTQAQYSYSGEPAAIATFGSSAALDEPAYAYYPYSAANDGKAPTALVGNLPATQDAVLVNGAWTGLHGDYKVGTNRLSESKERFNFKNIFSLARVVITDVENTPLLNERLTSITVSAKRGSEDVNIAGDFTFNATTGAYNPTNNLSNSVTINWTAGEGPVLNSGVQVVCYFTLFPVILQNDTFTITVKTANNYSAQITAVSKTAFVGETVYTFPVTVNT